VSICISTHGKPTESCWLFPTLKIAQGCQTFLSAKQPAVPSRIAEIEHDSKVLVYAVFVDAQDAKYAKEYWQHTGDGISSRYAQQCLAQLSPPTDSPTLDSRPRSNRGFGRNRHYSRKSSGGSESMAESAASLRSLASLESSHSNGSDEEIETTYVEQRYGRNLAASLAPFAKKALKRRIAGVLLERPQTSTDGALHSLQTEKAALKESGGSTFNRELHSTRGIDQVSEDDVFLYPTGMSAIFHAHETCLEHRKRSGKPLGKSVCFG
jgi:cystathionine gamma-synthase